MRAGSGVLLCSETLPATDIHCRLWVFFVRIALRMEFPSLRHLFAKQQTGFGNTALALYSPRVTNRYTE